MGGCVFSFYYKCLIYPELNIVGFRYPPGTNLGLFSSILFFSEYFVISFKHVIIIL